MTNFSEEMKKTAPEFAELFDNFALEEVPQQIKNDFQEDLDDRTVYMVNLAALLGCQGMEEYKVLLPMALKAGVTPVEIKEIIYQATAYLGIGRTYSFLKMTNEIMRERGINLPLEQQGTTTPSTRREAGTKAQVDIFGEGMQEFWKGGTINYYLAANCFGDYYTRKGLDLRQREMVTFCYIAAQGGCEPQLTSHAMANMSIGNDEKFLARVVAHMVPYIGYPRSLNAMACIRNAVSNMA